MGVSNSKPQADKALALCRERKRFVRQSIEGRSALASAHVSYIRSLQNAGTTLRKLVDPGPYADPSSCTTSATTEPSNFTKSNSQYCPSPSVSNHVEAAEILLSPTTSSPYASSQVHVNHMKSNRNASTSIKEKPNIPVTVTVHNSSNETTRSSISGSAESSSPSSPIIPQSKESSPWDYFDIFPSTDNQYSFQPGREMTSGYDDVYLDNLRKEEGIPDLEEEEGKEILNEKGVEIFDLVEEQERKYFHNGTCACESEEESELSCEDETSPKSQSHSRKVSGSSSHSQTPINESLIEKKKVTMPENDDYPKDTASGVTPTGILVLKTKKELHKETPRGNVITSKDFISCIKDIELLFIKASDSGKEVQKMLEANNVPFLPKFTEKQDKKSLVTSFFSACFTCGDDTVLASPDQAPSAMKLIAWHQSASTLSSSSRNPLASTSLRDDVDDSSNDYGDTFCMTSGSHASTLDRLYAWERKLSDEVKASGFIRSEYDMRCRQLRRIEARAEKQERVDKARAVVKDLHSRILVAIHRIDSISRKIEELRDKELHPQLQELIGGLARMWKMMLECHQRQQGIIVGAYITTQTTVQTHPQSQRQVVVELINELSSLNTSFTKWISAHRLYLNSLYDWLFKCVPLRHLPKRKKMQEFSPHRDGAPPIFVTCHRWLNLLNSLPAKEVSDAIKDLTSEARRFLPPQEENRRKNPSLTTSLSWKTMSQKDRDGYSAVDLEYREAHANLQSGFDSLQSKLASFLEKFVTFAAKSTKMFEDVKASTLEAHVLYHQRHGKRMSY